MSKSIVLIILCVALLCGYEGKSTVAAGRAAGPSAPKTAPVSPAASGDQMLLATEDIANCKMIAGAEATAKIIEGIPGTVAALGHLALSDGSAEEFANCYDKTWGAFKSRTRPAPGNHEFHETRSRTGPSDWIERPLRPRPRLGSLATA